MVHACQPGRRAGYSDVGQFSRKSVLCLIATLVLAGLTYCQADIATVSGVITDQSGAVVVGAEVLVTNTDTNVAWTSISNGSGVYLVTGLKPGRYRIHVGKEGFKGIDFTDLILNVQDSVSRNFTLQVGSTSESISVEGNELQINTQDASVSTVVDRQFAENLPMNGRSFQTLIYLTPGVVATSSTTYDSGQFSVNGQRPSSNYWTVDGVSANIGVSTTSFLGNGLGGTLGSFSALGGTNSLVSIDAMQEFRIQTSTFAPEFGRTPGGQISIVTRSGSNGFHGTAFDYVRNDIFDANNWFADSLGLPKPEERQNDFGGTFGGPIVKDKTFFFFSYEGLRLRLPQTTLSYVPDVSARQNAISAMQPYLNAYPLPNGTDNTTTGLAEFNAGYSDPATLDAYSLRVDQKLGNKVTLFGRYNYSPSEFDDRGTINGFDSLNTIQANRITTQTGTIGGTWAISPTLTNDARFNYSHINAVSDFAQDNFGGAVPLGTLPFPSSVNSQNGLFFFVVGVSVGGELAIGHNAQTIQHQFNVVDSLSVQKGSHSLKFGVDFRRLSPAFNPSQYVQRVSFSNVGNSETGASQVGFVVSENPFTPLFHNLGTFAQDTWRVIPRLTLTYGLRWDIDFVPSSLRGPGILAVTGYSLTDFSNLAIAPPGTPPFKTTFGNVAPRIGVAYQVSQSQDWQTVLRGGFGVFYDLVSSEAGNVLTFTAPPFAGYNILLNQPFPFTAGQIAPVPIPPNGTLANIDVFNPNLKLPYTFEWNVAIEQGLGKQQTLSVSYIGAAGRRLLQSTDVSFPPSNPNIGTAIFVDNLATSDYNALQLQFQRRLSHGLQVLASYTWSHSIDDASAGSYGNGSNLAVPGNDSENRGSSDFDIRNAFTAGITYDIPVPHSNSLGDAILRGWSVRSLILARSAPPVDLTDSNFFEFNSPINTNIRPDLVPGQPLYLYGANCASVMQALGSLSPGQSCPGGKGFNPAAFTNPPTDPNTGNPTRQGNLGRNVLRGFGATEWDFGVHRDFPVREWLKLQFRADMFNVLNHPNFGPPNNQFGGVGFGLANETLAQSLSGGNLGGGGLSTLYQIGGPRSIQLALKLIF